MPTVPVFSTPSWVGFSPQGSPFAHVPFLFPPPGIVSTPMMATLSLSNLTLGIPVWYLDPPAPPMPGAPTPNLVLTPVQPMVPTLVPTSTPIQAQPTLAKTGKGVSKGGKAKKTRGTNTSG